MSDVLVERFTEVPRFVRTVERYLLANEAAHNLIFGVLDSLLREPGRYTGDNYLAAVHAPNGISGVALRTPPYPLALSRMASPKATVALAEHIREAQPGLPSILTAPEVAGDFLRAWAKLGGPEGSVKRRQRIYALTRVVPPLWPPEGWFRPADSADHELVLHWAEGFQRDAFQDASSKGARRARELMTRKLSQHEMYVWEADGTLRSMAAAQGPTPNGIRLSWVYTPTEYRARGFASALVAALSQHLLDGGRSFVFLFADLDFPTSNHIYQAVGYEAVSDMNVYTLGDQDEVL